MLRRTLLTAPIALGGVLLGGQLVACSAPTAPPVRPSNPEVITATDSLEPSVVPASRVLLTYFSRAGENYYYGDRTILEVGNTEVVANLIAGAATVDVFRIEAQAPYPDSYDATVARNVQEQDDDARPAIAGTLPDVSGYDTVLVGSGLWNVQPPMIMRTFVEGVDLTGKKIFPFVTYAVSGLGRTIDVYTELCPQSTIGEGLAIRGEEALQAQSDVDLWLRSIGVLSL